MNTTENQNRYPGYTGKVEVQPISQTQELGEKYVPPRIYKAWRDGEFADSLRTPNIGSTRGALLGRYIDEDRKTGNRFLIEYQPSNFFEGVPSGSEKVLIAFRSGDEKISPKEIAKKAEDAHDLLAEAVSSIHRKDVLDALPRIRRAQRILVAIRDAASETPNKKRKSKMRIDDIVIAHPDLQCHIDELGLADDTDDWSPVDIQEPCEAAYATNGNPEDGLLVIYETQEPSLYAGLRAQELAGHPTE